MVPAHSLLCRFVDCLAVGRMDCQMVDQRRASILQEVVRRYIETSQPVSSSVVTQAADIDASAATVRAEMAALERDGYLEQPHTSAGRIPTDRGYRFFVDHLESSRELPRDQQQSVKGFFDHASSEIETLLHDTGKLLSRLTGAASLIVEPRGDEPKPILSSKLVSLSSSTALFVVVRQDGGVEKHTISLAESASFATFDRADEMLSHALGGLSQTSSLAVVPSDRREVDELVSAVLHQVANDEQVPIDDRVVVEGTSQLVGSFEAIETVRNVLAVLEQQLVVVSLIRSLLDSGAAVSIGRELEVGPLATCSLVVAPTLVDGEQRGSVAILGPTRMNYGRALAAVSAVSAQLSERIQENDMNRASETS